MKKNYHTEGKALQEVLFMQGHSGSYLILLVLKQIYVGLNGIGVAPALRWYIVICNMFYVLVGIESANF